MIARTTCCRSELRSVWHDRRPQRDRGRPVPTPHPVHFRWRQPLEHHILEIAREFCGRKAKWWLNPVPLHQVSGSKGNPKLFRQMMRKRAGQSDLLDKAVTFEGRPDIAMSHP